jgi:hypothetical protein
MVKKDISYIGLVKVMMSKARKDNGDTGKPIDTKSAFAAAAARWKKVKDGSDPEYSQGISVPGERKSSKKTKSKKETSSFVEASVDAGEIISDILTKLDLCDDCKTKIKAYADKTSKKNKKSRGTRKTKKRK